MKEQVDALLKALTQSGCDGARERMPDLVAAMKVGFNEELVRDVLDVLRGQRCFEAMATFAAAARPLAQGDCLVHVKRQLAQAWIEHGDLGDALTLLGELAGELETGGSKRERSEVAGLMGRAFKQKFVKAVKGGGTGEKDLKSAVQAYARGFDIDDDRGWHGANLAALVARAEREGLDVGTVSAKEWAARTLAALRTRSRASWGPWDYASAGEAYLALGDQNNVADCFSRYWNTLNADAFALAGTERNLREIWGITPEHQNEFLGSLVLHLEARKLTAPKGGALYTPAALQNLASQLRGAKGQAQATFGAGSAIPLQRVLDLLDRAKSVCRIGDLQDPDKAGTGFLVRVADLGQAGDALCVLTNHHVLHGPETSPALRATPDYARSIHIERAQAEFHFWDGNREVRKFKLKEVLCHSPRSEKDFALATLEEPVPSARALQLSKFSMPFVSRNVLDIKQRDKVIIIGHPGGDQISFSVSDNEIVDHELDEDPRERPRRIHYRTPTEPGSSGSPVFHHKSLEVVGLHRTGRAEPLRPDWPRARQDEVYEANEAVAIRSLLER
jgi:hypothetical protein